MKITYDLKYRMAYIQLSTRGKNVPKTGPKSTSFPVSEDVRIDVGLDGTVRGIELLNATQQLGGKIKLIDSNTKEKHVLLLKKPNNKTK